MIFFIGKCAFITRYVAACHPSELCDTLEDNRCFVLLVEIEEFAVMFFTGTSVPVLEAKILRMLIHAHFEKANSLFSLIYL